MNKRHGFTLMEILVVVVMLGIMAGFALPAYNNSLRKANERDATINLIAIHGAQMVREARTGAYWDGGAGNTASINTNLGLNIVENDVTYSCNGTFTCTATHTGGAFTISVTQAAIQKYVNPTCSLTCP